MYETSPQNIKWIIQLGEKILAAISGCGENEYNTNMIIY